MKLRLLSLSHLLFFALVANATTPEDFPLPESPNSQSQNNKADPKKDLENFDIAHPSDQTSTSTPKKFFLDHQSLHFMGAGVLRDGQTEGLLGFQYMIPSQRSWNWEAGADIFLQEEKGAFHAGLKKQWQRYKTFRPFVKGAVALKADGSDSIALIADIENWRLRSSVGFEHLIWYPLGYRIEAEASIGTNQFTGQLRAGFSWVWD